MISFAAIGPVLLRYWKPISIGLGVFLLIFGIYSKGKRDCQRKVESAVAREQERIRESVEREREKTSEVRDRIRLDRTQNPQNDERDSCILSNDPFSVECVK